MKRTLCLLFTAFCFAACQVEELFPESLSDNDVLYASMESIDATRTSMDEYNNVLWSENDQLVAFMKTTLGIKYQVKEQYIGTTTGGFSKVQDAGSGDDLESGQEIDHNVVLYPYSDQVWCMKYDNSIPSKAYKLNVVLPETQTYAENSFGNGSFPMVAVSTNNQLTFKNISGGVKLQFKGVDKIKSIKLEGICGEAISGKSSVVAYADGATPTITMASTASKSVTLDCGDGVQLNETTPTAFVIAVPPVTFASGLKITITDTDGLVKTLTNTASNTVKRSTLLNFPVITYKQNGVLEFPEGTMTSYEVPAEGGTVEIPVVTNQDYEVVIPDNAKDWVSVVTTKVLREEVVTLNISQNPTAEVRSAEVLITALSGSINQVISISQEEGEIPMLPGDYIDEYGINHGPGILKDGVIWAPVNCGYHSTDFKYGKLYQWGRKYGQGYNGNSTKNDGILPVELETWVQVDVANDVANSNVFYISNNDNKYDWLYPHDNRLWNAGSESNPIKTEYDPCPEGWRVPTAAELCRLYDDWWTKNDLGQYGNWLKAYWEDELRIFFLASGKRHSYGPDSYDKVSSADRDKYGYYWSSSPDDDYPYSCNLRFGNDFSADLTSSRASGYSVRCVQDSQELIPVTSVTPSVSLLELFEGETYSLDVSILPKNANHQYASWYSDDSEIVQVDQSGGVLAISEGTAKITAVAGLKVCTVKVIVKNKVPVTDDYIDEYGINHGKGVNIDGLVWAPVNCGYHAVDFKYGKLYQWGRKFGQGYSGDIYDEGGNVMGTYSDSVLPVIKTDVVTIEEGNDPDNSNMFYTEWYTGQEDGLWNRGTLLHPLKTEYDPCPDGWRVPSYSELESLGTNYSPLTLDNEERLGYWFCGGNEYATDIAKVFLPIPGSLLGGSGDAHYRGYDGVYWSSKISDTDNYAIGYFVMRGCLGLYHTCTSEGNAIRCVLE